MEEEAGGGEVADGAPAAWRHEPGARSAAAQGGMGEARNGGGAFTCAPSDAAALGEGAEGRGEQRAAAHAGAVPWLGAPGARSAAAAPWGAPAAEGAPGSGTRTGAAGARPGGAAPGSMAPSAAGAAGATARGGAERARGGAGGALEAPAGGALGAASSAARGAASGAAASAAASAAGAAASAVSADEAGAVALLLWRAARQPHASFAAALTAAEGVQARVPLEAGAVVVADVARGAAWRYTCAAASVNYDAGMRALSRAATASGTFAVRFIVGAAPPSRGVLANAPSGLRAHFGEVHGLAAAELWREAAAGAGDVLLPRARRALEDARASVAREAAVAAAAGEAGARSEASVSHRAVALLLLRELQETMRGGGGASYTPCLLRRAARAATADANGAERGEGPAHWADLEALVQASGWPRLTEASCGYPFDVAGRGVLPGEMAACDANGLVEIFVAAFGKPGPDHPLWTIAAHAHAHVPAIEPWLDEAVERAWRTTGEPLRLYRRGEGAALSPAQVALFKEQVARLLERGVLTGPLTPEQLSDPRECSVITRLDVVFRGNLRLNAEEKDALDAGDARRIAALAAQRAAGMAAEAVALAEDAAARGERLAGGAVAERVFADHIGEMTKVRPINAAHALGKAGWKRDGVDLPRYSIKKFSSVGPSGLELLDGVTRGLYIGRQDMADYFYHFVIALAFRRYFCVAVDYADGQGEAVYRMTRTSMGMCDSGGLATSVSTIITHVANAGLVGVVRGRGGIVTAMDDMCSLAGSVADGDAIHAHVAGLLEKVSITEVLKKRERHARRAVILGRQWDLTAGTMSLPLDRAHRYLLRVGFAWELLRAEQQLARDVITTSYLESVTGALVWWAEVVEEGAAHLGALFAITKHGNSLRDDARRRGVVECLGWWLGAAKRGELDGVLFMDGAVSEPLYELAVDASGHALGAVDFTNKRAAWRALLPDERVTDAKASASGYRELLAVELAVGTLVAQIEPPPLSEPGKRTRVCILTDATAALGALHRSSAEGRGGAVIARVVRKAAALRAFYLGVWCPRERNQIPDGLSKAATREEAEAFCARHGLELVR
jgi:hypothetical protein